MVHFENLEFNDQRLRVELHGVGECFANMLRRALTDVPVPAATFVTFKRNNSAFCDEILAHRIGLIPLISHAPQHRPATLKVRGPRVVRASEIVCLDAEVATPDTLVVVLNDGEEVDAEIEIGIATGKEHARHSAAVATRCVRRHVGMHTVAHLGDPLQNECFCDETAWGSLCERCAGQKRPANARDAPLVFILEFETTGALPPLELLRRSLEQVKHTSSDVSRQAHSQIASPIAEREK